MFGYEDSALTWVDSYLSGRKQAEQVQASYSEFWEVIKGVPQGFFGDYIPMSTFRYKK